MKKLCLLLCGLALTLAMITACGADDATATPAPEATQAPQPTARASDTPAAEPDAAPDADSLANMEYQSGYTASGTAPLSNGAYSEPAAPGSATEITVQLTEHIAYGELNGQPAAAVILVTDPGGSGTFYDLAVVMQQDGEPFNVATTMLGDRVQIDSLSIEDGQIRVEMVNQGPNDPMCCPTQQVVQTYALHDGELVRISTEVVGTAQTSGESSGSEIIDVLWNWESFRDPAGVNSIDVDDPDQYTLMLQTDGQFNIQADCNSGSGSYILRDNGIIFQPGPTTLAECGPDSLYADFLELLGDVATYVVEDGKLVLNLKMDAGDMVFVSSDAIDSAEPAGSDPVGIVWTWQNFAEAAGQNDINVPDPERYQLEFRAGGQFNYQADCNLGSGTYTLDDNNLTLELGPATMAECGPQSLMDQYINLLAQVVTYEREGEVFILNLKDDGGSMVFGKLNAVTGQVVAERNLPLPEGSKLEVKVMDVSLADAPATQVGGQIIADVMQLPIPFEAPFNAEEIQENHEYALDVTITDPDTNLLFRNTQAYPVITRDNPTYNVQVTVEDVTGQGGGGVQGLGVDPSQISLDAQGLPYAWQANVVAATPYDDSSPSGPVGLPEHIQINFGVTSPDDREPGDPVMYIIPVDTYTELWEAAGNTAVPKEIDRIYRRVVAIPVPPPTSVQPALPFGEIGGGVNDLALHLDRGEIEENSATVDGYRFLGRWEQRPSPVVNGDLRYIYQGFTNDGRYLVAFFYPVGTAELPDSVEDVPAEEMRDVATNIAGYLQDKVELLNGLFSSDWEPDLALLDALVGSLAIEGMPASGIHDKVWGLVAKAPDGVNETALGDTEAYTLLFKPDGTMEFQADCISATAPYTSTGAVAGSLMVDLSATSWVECDAEPLAVEFVDMLMAAQDYRLRPGGDRLELVTRGAGPVYVFENLGFVAEATIGRNDRVRPWNAAH
jgi:uncharacterized lipoprotein YbaY/heat shock protein HslJ